MCLKSELGIFFFIINVCCVIVFKKLIFLEVNCFKWDVSLLDVKVIILIIFYVVICGGIFFLFVWYWDIISIS